MRVYAGKGREVLLQQVVGTHHEVLLLITVDHDIRYLQVAIYSRRELLVHLEHLKGVTDGNRIENGLQIMVTVRATFYDVKPEVDFADRMRNHISIY